MCLALLTDKILADVAEARDRAPGTVVLAADAAGIAEARACLHRYLSELLADVSELLPDVAQLLADVSELLADGAELLADVSELLADVSELLVQQALSACNDDSSSTGITVVAAVARTPPPPPLFEGRIKTDVYALLWSRCPLAILWINNPRFSRRTAADAHRIPSGIVWIAVVMMAGRPFFVSGMRRGIAIIII